MDEADTIEDLTGLYALERTLGVGTGRRPLNALRESVLERRGNAQS
ncbi:hypothetical protein NJ7G_4026 [Natrinema sp. J7-2]|nr:hypothetical protein NJ7G_4026 [Natrinema sp. J7-2]